MKHMILILTLAISAMAMDNIYVLCEGNFGSTNSSLWQIDDENTATIPTITGFNASEIGDIGQSMKIVDQTMYIVVNNSHSIEVLNVSDEGILSYNQTIDVSGAAPRYLEVLNNYAYVTSWNLNAILQIDLNDYTVVDTISVLGMPEDILSYDGKLYVSMNMNTDWTSGNTVKELALENGEWGIINSFDVITGPGNMLLDGDQLYVASTYYDDAWQSYAGTSKINLTTGDILAVDYGQSYSYGGDLAIMDENIYRSTSTGAAILNDSLQLVNEGAITSLSSVYAFAILQDKFYFGLTDYTAPDDIRVFSANGDSLDSYTVGALPGTFAIYGTSNNIVSEIEVPSDFSIIANYPNPFNPSTTIQFSVDKPMTLSAQIVDIASRVVTDYAQQTYSTGKHSLVWNGQTNAGRNVSSGIYFMVLSSSNDKSIRRMTLLR